MLGTTGDTKEFDVGENLGVSSRVQAVVDYFGPTDFLQMDAHRLPNGMVHDPPDSPESQLVGGAIQENKDKVAKANPITYVTKNAPPFPDLPRRRDPLVPHHQSELLEAALKQAGVPVTFYTVKGGGHGGFKGPERAATDPRIPCGDIARKNPISPRVERDEGSSRGADGVVAGGAVRHVHPLGAGEPDGAGNQLVARQLEPEMSQQRARRRSRSTTTSTSSSIRSSSTPASGWPRRGRPGMKYMVLTAKHCDGFLLWHSQADDYNIASTPFRRDVCGELAKAAHDGGHEAGLVLLADGLARSGFPHGTQCGVRRADAGGK